MKTAHYHLPGLFEFYEFYQEFLPIYRSHRDYFYDWCDIASIYGAPEDCLWSGGRISTKYFNPKKVLEFVGSYNISARLTFSNSLLEEKHLKDEKCNKLCRLFDKSSISNGIIVSSDLLLNYLKANYPNLYFISSTTKVLTNFNDLHNEIKRKEFKYVVPDFRLNKSLDKLMTLTQEEKDKVEFLCNECCYYGCKDRNKCYENVSRQHLDEDIEDFVCRSPYSNEGYRFSRAMQNPGFISIEDIQKTYLPSGFTQFKIEGRSLGSALLLEFILYYMVKPEYHIHIREMLYLDNTLDLF